MGNFRFEGPSWRARASELEIERERGGGLQVERSDVISRARFEWWIVRRIKIEGPAAHGSLVKLRT